MSAPAQAFASIRGEAGEVLAIGRLSIADGWAGITAVEVTQARRRAGLGMALTRAICAEAAARGARQVFLQVASDNIPARILRDPRPRRHAEAGVFQLGPGARYVCNHGYPCVQELGSFAKRAGGR
jgi:GNAT superfamily N-acetyltransferase